jgi:hypothetical protein
MNARILQSGAFVIRHAGEFDMRLQMPWWTSLNLPRLIIAGATVVTPVPGSRPLTQTGMDELNASDLTLGAWGPVGVFASGAWVVIAPFSGRSVVATVVLPMIMGLWIYSIVIVDRWVRKRQRTS